MKSSSAGLSARLSSAGVLRRSSKRTYAQKVLSIAPASLLTYWPLWEPSGTVITDISPNARNGVYTGVDLGQPGIGDGRTSPLFDGTNDYGNLYSAGLASAFNGEEGSLVLWGRVANVGVWTDGAVRRLATLQVDANNRILLAKQASNMLQAFYFANAVNKNLSTTISTTDWFSYVLTWSKAADQMKVYVNGVQSGATQTSLGAWVGALASNATLLGSNTPAPSNAWSGWLAHVAIWNTPLSAAQIASLATL